jgi:hypothetical protein
MWKENMIKMTTKKMYKRLEEGEQQVRKKKGECEKNRIDQMKLYGKTPVH